MKNVLVLGAGKIGRMVASLLQGSGDYQVLVMDSHDAYIKETLALSPGATGTVGRFDDQAAVDKALDGQWAVVSCAPFFCNPMIAERAKAHGVHYLDLTEDVAVTKKVQALAQGASTAFIPQCGLARLDAFGPGGVGRRLAAIEQRHIGRVRGKVKLRRHTP